MKQPLWIVFVRYFLTSYDASLVSRVVSRENSDVPASFSVAVNPRWCHSELNLKPERESEPFPVLQQFLTISKNNLPRSAPILLLLAYDGQFERPFFARQ